MVLTRKRQEREERTAKTQTNWRILTHVLLQLDDIKEEYGFSTIPTFVNYILAQFVSGKTIIRK